MSAKPITLAALASQFEVELARAETLLNRIPTERINQAPAPGRWSVGECLAHLNTSVEGFLSLWRRELPDVRARGLSGAEPYRMDFKGWLLGWLLEPPSRIKMPAPAAFQPRAIPAAEEALSRFLATHRQFLDILKESRGLPLDKMMIRSPADSRVTYSVWSSYRITLSHTRRHVLQAERAAEALSS